MTNYYNEIDGHAAQWLRNLIEAGHIAPGYVDERSIEDVYPSDLKGFTQCHFFAGVGVWSRALRSAGWADDRPVWTGSAPCQPFSVAGKGDGTKDDRHLWPAFYRLIRECRPSVIFGEQVASSIVIGKAVQNMRGNKASARLQDAQWRGVTRGVQELREHASERKKDMGDGWKTCVSSGTQAHSSWVFSDERRETESIREGLGIRSGLEGCAEADRHRILRSDGNPFRSNDPEIMERAISRSKDSEARVHKCEHSGCSLCDEHDGKRVGGRFDIDDCGCDSQETVIERVERLIAKDCEKSDEENRTVWIDALLFDLEAAHYTCGAVVIPSCGFGAPHIRQRLYWVAHTQQHDSGCQATATNHGQPQADRPADWTGGCGGAFGGLADTIMQQRPDRQPGISIVDDAPGWLKSTAAPTGLCSDLRPGPTNGFWRDADWIGCRDGKFRPVEPGTFPLAYGVASRVVKLRAYGNAINAQAAQGFIEAVMEIAA